MRISVWIAFDNEGNRVALLRALEKIDFRGRDALKITSFRGKLAVFIPGTVDERNVPYIRKIPGVISVWIS